MNWQFSVMMFWSLPFHKISLPCVTPGKSLWLLINGSFCNWNIHYLWVCVFEHMHTYIYLHIYIFLSNILVGKWLVLYFAFSFCKKAVSLRVFLRLMKGRVFFVIYSTAQTFQWFYWNWLVCTHITCNSLHRFSSAPPGLYSVVWNEPIDCTFRYHGNVKLLWKLA